MESAGITHASICAQGNVPVGPSRFIHVEQRLDARRASTDPSATPGRNRGVVVAGILACHCTGPYGLQAYVIFPFLRCIPTLAHGKIAG
jgi:hypothetical protein